MPHAAKSKFASGNRNWRANAWPSIATDRPVCRAVPAKGAGGQGGRIMKRCGSGRARGRSSARGLDDGYRKAEHTVVRGRARLPRRAR